MNRISGILDQTLKKLPCAKKVKGQQLIDLWSEVVGEHIASKSIAMQFENGVLHVWVKDSVWAQHLSFQKKQITSKLNRLVRTNILKDIRYQVGGKIPSVHVLVASNESQQNWRNRELPVFTVNKIEQSFDGTNLPKDLEVQIKTFFVSQQKKIEWYFEQGYPPCQKCGMPIVTANKEEVCLCCKTEGNG